MSSDQPASAATQPPGNTEEDRELTEVREMRALTHPVRLALLEVLAIEGPLTATEAGEHIRQSATTCSFHLRQLAKYGFVEEAGGGAGRRRPWKLVSRGVRFSGTGADTEQSVAATELSSLLVQRWMDRHHRWTQVQHLDPVWAESAGASQFATFLTPEEAASVREEVAAVFARYKARLSDPDARPPGARAVESVMFMHPIVDYGLTEPKQ